MREVERAIAQVADIRQQLAASTRFRGYAPEAVAMIGVMAMLIMAAQLMWPERFAIDDRQQVLIWGAVLAGAGAVMGLEALVRSHREHADMAPAMLRGALRSILPSILIGVALPFAVLSYAPDAAWIIPGVWQMLIGVALFASYSSMPPATVWPGAWQLVSGAVALVLAGQGGELTPVLAGVPFVCGYLAIAWSLSQGGNRRAA